MVAIYVGVTDGDWFRFVSQRPDITEVNLWQPVNTRRFGALIPGELFLFKLKAPDHFIAGGGLFVAANAYPTSLAGLARIGEGACPPGDRSGSKLALPKSVQWPPSPARALSAHSNHLGSDRPRI